jgi:SulP family sulfate permease
LAIVIGLAQLGSFKTLSAEGTLVYLTGAPLYLMLGLVALTMAIIWLLPKITSAVPASLAAILTVTLISIAINQSTGDSDKHSVATVGDMLQVNQQAKLNAAQLKSQIQPLPCPHNWLIRLQT